MTVILIILENLVIKILCPTVFQTKYRILLIRWDSRRNPSLQLERSLTDRSLVFSTFIFIFKTFNYCSRVQIVYYNNEGISIRFIISYCRPTLSRTIRVRNGMTFVLPRKKALSFYWTSRRVQFWNTDFEKNQLFSIGIYNLLRYNIKIQIYYQTKTVRLFNGIFFFIK